MYSTLVSPHAAIILRFQGRDHLEWKGDFCIIDAEIWEMQSGQLFLVVRRSENQEITQKEESLAQNHSFSFIFDLPNLGINNMLFVRDFIWGSLFSIL